MVSFLLEGDPSVTAVLPLKQPPPFTNAVGQGWLLRPLGCLHVALAVDPIEDSEGTLQTGGHHDSCFMFFQEMFQSTLAEVENQKQLYQPLLCEKSKPVPLKLFTPRLVKV